MKQTVLKLAMNAVEHGRVPDAVVRGGIRSLIRRRLGSLPVDDPAGAARHREEFVETMRASAVAPVPERANEQHYEVPADFYSQVLGVNRKYSSCYWSDDIDTLDQAEDEALARTCHNAALADGQKVLELGCGWGSLTLWMAQHYPASRIVAVSNSASQKQYIEQRAAERGLSNIQVIKADMNDFSIDGGFDRIVSVEMFEHMRNYEVLFQRISRWLTDDGRFFMHIFCHREIPYEFVDQGAADWMGRHFFSGGIMPCDSLPLAFQRDLEICDQKTWNGRHYQTTAQAWLDNMDARRPAVMESLAGAYGAPSAARWWMRWRVFFMACAELFGYDHGNQWYVKHYLFRKPGGA